jgi:hypothetical protein
VLIVRRLASRGSSMQRRFEFNGAVLEAPQHVLNYTQPSLRPNTATICMFHSRSSVLHPSTAPTSVSSPPASTIIHLFPAQNTAQLDLGMQKVEGTASNDEVVRGRGGVSRSTQRRPTKAQGALSVCPLAARSAKSSSGHRARTLQTRQQELLQGSH